MGLFLLDLLALPALGPPKLALWLATTLSDAAARELFDEAGVRGELLELQGRYEAGELEEAEYERQEGALLERLRTIRQLKAEAAGKHNG